MSKHINTRTPNRLKREQSFISELADKMAADEVNNSDMRIAYNALRRASQDLEKASTRLQKYKEKERKIKESH